MHRKNTDHMCKGLCLSNITAVLPAITALYCNEIWLGLACLLAGTLSGFYHYYSSHIHCMTDHGSSKPFSMMCHAGDWVGVLTLGLLIVSRLYANFYLPPLALVCFIAGLVFMLISERPGKRFDPTYVKICYYRTTFGTCSCFSLCSCLLFAFNVDFFLKFVCTDGSRRDESISAIHLFQVNFVDTVEYTIAPLGSTLVASLFAFGEPSKMVR